MDKRLNKTFIPRRVALLLATGVIAVVATACGSAASLATPTAETPRATATPTTVAVPSATATPIPTPEPTSIAEPDPTATAGFETDVFEELNPRPELRAIDRSIDFGFDEREVLPRDAINPVYSPKFVSPEEVQELILENELVMGLSINGDARAYPVGIMRFREIVNDEVGGVPLLVTW